MFRIIVSICAAIWASHASAADCPDFFRFVDFGLESPDGTLHRGGPIFRAESLDGRPLLFRERTKCLSVTQIASDGHGNPIPVAQAIHYNPKKSGLDLDVLRVGVVSDAHAEAEETAKAHRLRVAQTAAEIIKGESFLCVQSETPRELSCQTVSPYSGNAPLVVYCTPDQCRMPALAVDTRLQVSAAWNTQTHLEDTEAASEMIIEKVSAIHAFLDPLSQF